jgi:hypothetical protein
MDLTGLLITNNGDDKEEKLMNVYNVVSFTLTLMIGSKVDNVFLQMLDTVAPITDINTLMKRFDNDHHIAMQLYRDYANILKCWELSAIKKYELTKFKLIEMRNVEVLLKFIDEQNSSLKSFFNHLLRKLSESMKDLLVDRMAISDTLAIEVEVKVKLFCQKGLQEKTLDDALNLITRRKIEIEKRIQILSLYVRCVRELAQINASNITKIHYHRIRGGAKKDTFKEKIRFNFPISKTHQYFSQKFAKIF